MGIITNYQGALHRIRVKLYPNYLPNIKGAFIARTDAEASLNIDKICETMKDRGGFSGKYEDLVENVKQFLNEVAYQLCDGFAVNLRFFSIHPNIGGTFESVKDPHDPVKNPVKFKFRVLKTLRELKQHITIEITSVADGNAFIYEFTDTEEDSVNGLFVAGNLFTLSGSKIKVAGDDLGCGVFFVPVDDPSQAVKATRLAENSPTRIIGIAPSTGHQYNRIEVRTQYAGSGTTLLKTPRVITSDFIIEEA
jgi:hypothetical protein